MGPAERVAVQSPTGVVRVVTRAAFEAVHRLRGFRIIDTPGADPNRWVGFLASDPHGGGRVRSEWPAAALMQAGWHTRTGYGWPGGLNEGDVLVIHRPLPASTDATPAEYVRLYRSIGVRVLVDEDDELERIPRQNAAQVAGWQLRAHRDAIEEADGLIVTTARLEEVYGPWARQVWRCPNYVPRWVNGLGSDLPPGERVRVGWAGLLATHRQDIEWLAPVARDAFRDAEFVTVGDAGVPGVLGLEPGTFIARPAEWDVQRYYRKMARADIGIVPLDNGRNRLFNTSKSSLKTNEFVALGKPVVATDLPEHRALLEGTGAGFLADTPKAFAEAVQTLVHDAALRDEMTAAALELRERLAIEEHVEEWAVPLRAVTEPVAVGGVDEPVRTGR